MQYRTKDGDVLDLICLRVYGDASPGVEAVLTLNPGLAAVGPILPAGIVIELPPARDTAAQVQTIRLWD